ncbi:MAG: hypothetical protein AB8B92_11965 [Gammaproteobacteria bacterium]
MQTLNIEVREQIFDMYVNKKLSTYEIAQKLIKTERTICRWLKEYGIPKRDNTKLDIPILRNKHWLIEMYVNQKKSAKEMGRMVKVSDETVRKSLIEHGIPRRIREKEISVNNQGNEKNEVNKFNTHQHGTWSVLL